MFTYKGGCFSSRVFVVLSHILHIPSFAMFVHSLHCFFIVRIFFSLFLILVNLLRENKHFRKLSLIIKRNAFVNFHFYLLVYQFVGWFVHSLLNSLTSRAPKTERVLIKLKTSIVLTLQCLLELLDGQDNGIEIEAKAAFTVREVTSKNSYFPLCWSVQFYLPHVSEFHFALSIENLQRRIFRERLFPFFKNCFVLLALSRSNVWYILFVFYFLFVFNILLSDLRRESRPSGSKDIPRKRVFVWGHLLQKRLSWMSFRAFIAMFPKIF